MKIEIKHNPWDESHAPRNFVRKDPTGRWSPIEEEDSQWLSDMNFIYLLWALWGAIAAVIIVLALFVEVVR